MRDKYCKIVIFELPVGEYELFTWKLFFNYGLAQWEERLKDEISINFSIKPDSVNYIGELSIDNYIMRISDKGKRDLKIAFVKEPSISELSIFKYEMPCESGCIRKKENASVFIYLPKMQSHK